MEILIYCPYCKVPIIINKKEINCAIFRHGTFIKNGQQIDPHTKKEICDFLAKEGYIYGCGKPFRLIIDKDEQFYALKCDYI